MSCSSISELADAVEDRLDLVVDVLVRGVLVMPAGVTRGVEETGISGAVGGKARARLLTERVIKLSGLRRGEAVACDSLGSVCL